MVKQLWVYIKEHELQNPKDRRKIVLDDALARLFKPPLNMFNMNKQLSRHVYVEGAAGMRRRLRLPGPQCGAAVMCPLVSGQGARLPRRSSGDSGARVAWCSRARPRRCCRVARAPPKPDAGAWAARRVRLGRASPLRARGSGEAAAAPRSCCGPILRKARGR